MRRILIGVAVLATLAVVGVLAWGSVSNPVEAKKPANAGMPKEVCVQIKDGVLEYSAGHYLEGEPLTLGYDVFGYNYKAHMFNGDYANAYLGRDGYPPYEGDDDSYLAENPGAKSHWVWEYRGTDIMMKWSDEWLSNQDCNEDGKLDRGYSCNPELANDSGCSGAWLTNHERGSYMEEDVMCDYNYFIKIVTPDTAEAIKDGGVWWTKEDEPREIGPVIWGAFAIVQEVSNDSCAGEHGLLDKSDVSPGLGFYTP